MLFINGGGCWVTNTRFQYSTTCFRRQKSQAERIKRQNEAFISKEQSGDAYKFSKDTCQELSK